MKAVLHVTGACNLRCRYCYVGEKSDAAMSPEVARAAVDLVARESRGPFTVSYLGGEPLLRYDLIRETTEHAERVAAERGVRVSFRMTTNGLLFDDQKLRWCRDHKLLFALSLDGDARSHDANRVFADGSGSHARLDRLLDAILGNTLVLIVITVVTPATAPHLADAVRWLLDRGVDKIILSPDFGGEWDRRSLKALERSYRAMADDYVERHRRGVEVYLSLFDEKIASHALGPVKRGTLCDMGATSFSVGPTGEIYPCVQFVKPHTDLRFRIGTVQDGFDSDKRWELVALNRKPRPLCADCDLDGRCANWCGCVNHRTTGDVLEVPPFLCEHERMAMPIADQVGNLLYRERNEVFLRKFYAERLEAH